MFLASLLTRALALTEHLSRHIAASSSLGWVREAWMAYFEFRRGQLNSAVLRSVPDWICVLNPWVGFALAASHGALGYRASAWRHYRLLRFFPPYRFLAARLAKSWGVSQVSLARRLLAGDSHDALLLNALELVVGRESYATLSRRP
jgi:hypothetical protein